MAFIGQGGTYIHEDEKLPALVVAVHDNGDKADDTVNLQIFPNKLGNMMFHENVSLGDEEGQFSPIPTKIIASEKVESKPVKVLVPGIPVTSTAAPLPTPTTVTPTT